jgi:hypothetical protein
LFLCIAMLALMRVTEEAHASQLCPIKNFARNGAGKLQP